MVSSLNAMTVFDSRDRFAVIYSPVCKQSLQFTTQRFNTIKTRIVIQQIIQQILFVSDRKPDLTDAEVDYMVQKQLSKTSKSLQLVHHSYLMKIFVRYLKVESQRPTSSTIK